MLSRKNIIQVTLYRKIMLYLWIYIYVYKQLLLKKEVINLKDSKKWYVGGLRRKGEEEKRCKDIIISKTQRKKKKSKETRPSYWLPVFTMIWIQIYSGEISSYVQVRTTKYNKKSAQGKDTHQQIWVLVWP